MLYVKEYNKFRLPLRSDPISKEVKQEWNLQLFRLLKLPVPRIHLLMSRDHFMGVLLEWKENMTYYG